MTQSEKKSYIIQNWKVSSGSKIAEMLKRYFASLKEVDNFEVAKKIFFEAK